jgi:hypothetical protein
VDGHPPFRRPLELANWAFQIHFTTLDVVRFQMVNYDEAPSDEEEEGSADEDDDSEETAEVKKKPAVGPVTIWVGVFPDRTPATAAHDAAQVVLALLARSQITDVDIDFRESLSSANRGKSGN